MATLYLVPTPIGNLEDITLRALRILREVDLILAEDTRTTGNLLRHFEITTKMHSHHKFNEHRACESVVERLRSGTTIALVSDAGSPCISDPGFLLVRSCVEAGIRIEALPGATALIPALSVSGLPSDRFLFEGFLPQKKGRQTRIKLILAEERTIVFYESPHRIVKTLQLIKELGGGERPVSLSREISKRFEETIRGTVEEALTHFTTHDPKGEFVITLAGNDNSTKNKKATTDNQQIN